MIAVGYRVRSARVLKVVKDTNSTPLVKMQRGKILVRLAECRADKPEGVRELLKQWYRARAKYIFSKRLQYPLPLTGWVTDLPEFRKQKRGQAYFVIHSQILHRRPTN